MTRDTHLTSPRIAWVLAAALALAVSGCGGGDDGPVNASPAPKVTIVVADDAYEPDYVRIEAGTRVTFVGRGTAPNTVETTGVASFEYDRKKLDRQERFDLHTIEPGEAHSVEFDTPGYYSFHSSFNGTMFGAVEVVARRR